MENTYIVQCIYSFITILDTTTITTKTKTVTFKEAGKFELFTSVVTEYATGSFVLPS